MKRRRLKVIYPSHSCKSYAEYLRGKQEWADRYYTCQWDWDKPVKKPTIEFPRK